MAGIVPDMDWSPLANLGNVYRQSREREQLQQGLQSMGLPGNMSLAQLALQQQAVQRGEARDTRDFALRERLASPEYIGNIARTKATIEGEFAPKTTNIKTAGGDEITVEKGPNGYRIPQIEGQSATPNNPFAQGKLNDTQSKDALFARRLLANEQILRGIDADVATDRIQKGLGTISDKIGYNLRSKEFQKFDQAKRDFINAVLRKESGAVIAESEFKNAEQQYFPQPGEGAEAIAQKRAARMEAIRGIAAGAGQGFTPATMFDEKGDIVPNPAAQRRAPAAAAQAAPPVPGARPAPDGNFYVPDPDRPGKYLKVIP